MIALTPHFIPHFCPVLRLFLGVIKPRFSGLIVHRSRERWGFTMPFGVAMCLPPSLGERIAKPKVEGCSLVALGTLLDLVMEGDDFIIQLANRSAIESMYVWECPTNVVRCCCERFWNICRLELGNALCDAQRASH